MCRILAHGDSFWLVPSWNATLVLLGCSVGRTGCCAGAGRAAGTVGHWWHHECHPHVWEGLWLQAVLRDCSFGSCLNSALPWSLLRFNLSPNGPFCATWFLSPPGFSHFLFLHVFPALAVTRGRRMNYQHTVSLSWAITLNEYYMGYVKIESGNKETCYVNWGFFSLFFFWCFHLFCSGDYCAIYSLCGKYNSYVLNFSYFSLYSLKCEKCKRHSCTIFGYFVFILMLSSFSRQQKLGGSIMSISSMHFFFRWTVCPSC